MNATETVDGGADERRASQVATGRLDGRSFVRDRRFGCDVAIVGSGPAGATVAAELSALGLDVIVLEAGRWFEPSDFSPTTFGAMASAYRQMGASVVVGSAPIPYVQGKMVGGSSPINGAICWRLPQDVYDRWLLADPALGDRLAWSAIEQATDRVEARHNVAPTPPEIAGRKNLLMAAGAAALGLDHEPIRRNVDGCEGLGRCLQGCPKGAKLSVDRTYLLDAQDRGGRVISSVEVTKLVVDRGRVTGVIGFAPGGAEVLVKAKHAVVLAASAVQTPALLIRNGLTQGPVGQHFQAHPGVSMTGRFPEPVNSWIGATQGHRVNGLRQDGIKFEVLGYGPDLLAVRLPGFGRRLARGIEDIDHILDWGAAVRAEAHGRVRVWRGRTLVSYTPTTSDVAKFRRGLRVMGEMMFAAGADHVDLGVRGYRSRVHDPVDLAHFDEHGPRHPAAFTSAITHMFGTARMGSDPEHSVVGLDFQHHNIERLFVADSSVFPTNTGVNPQISIMALAMLCARGIAGADLYQPSRRNLETR